MAFSASVYELEIDSSRRTGGTSTDFYIDLPFSIPQEAKQIQLGVVYISDQIDLPAIGGGATDKDHSAHLRIYIQLDAFENKIILPYLWPSKKFTFAVNLGEKIQISKGGNTHSFYKFIPQDDQHQTLKISKGSAKINRLGVRLVDSSGNVITLASPHVWKFVLRIEQEDFHYCM